MIFPGHLESFNSLFNGFTIWVLTSHSCTSLYFSFEQETKGAAK